MILYGKLIKRNLPLKDIKVEMDEDKSTFHKTMETLFVELCKELDIPVPIWLKKNTREITSFKKTFFGKEQFIEKVYFDKFILEIEV